MSMTENLMKMQELFDRYLQLWIGITQAFPALL